MAYKKQTWVDLETPLDAEHMNHIEDGIGSLSEEIAKIDANAPTSVKSVTGDKLITVGDKADGSVRGLKLFGKTTQNGTPSAETPIDLVSSGSDGNIKVDFIGKNQLGGEAFKNAFLNAFPQKDAIYFDPDGLMKYFPSGGRGNLYDAFKPNTTYTFIFHAKAMNDKILDLSITYTDGSIDRFEMPEKNVFATVAFHSNPKKSIQVLKGSWYGNGSFFYCDDCGIFEGELTVEDFEPYTVYGSLTATTAEGLSGVPVTSDGNYTDDNGQQWISDEIDFGRGVSVKRCAVIESYDRQNVSGAYMSTTGALTTGARVIYALDNAVENPLTADELAQFETLNTPYPATNMVNDAGAGMGLTYTAEKDTALEVEVKNLSNQLAIVLMEFHGEPSLFNLPVLYLSGDITGMSKDVAVDLGYAYGDISGTASVKWQGSSSLVYPKKNYTIKFDQAFEAKGGWGAQSKYCLKANWIDFSHARNVVSAKLWGELVGCRSNVHASLMASPNKGAVDGFPVCIVLNDEFMGVYTLNIPKDGWMANMGSGTNECILCADANSDANIFKATAVLGTDFDVEYITDENSTEWATNSLNTLINACINSNGSDLDTTIATMLDWESAIDWMIFVVLAGALDMTSKNYLLYTYDGTKWFFGGYDMDSTFGLMYDGKSFLLPTNAGAASSFARLASYHRVAELIYTYKKDALKARYAQVRAGVMSEANVGYRFRNFVAPISRALLDADNRKWTQIPITNGNDVNQILDWYRLRCQIIDAEIEAL